MGRRGRHCTALLVATLAAFSAGCTSPGTDQAVLAYRCATAPLEKAPTEKPVSFDPVWRTYRAASVSLSLPADWDGLALGTSHVHADLADAGQRSPQIADLLTFRVGNAPDGTMFLGIGAPSGSQLLVSQQPLGNAGTHCMAASLGVWQGWAFGHGYHLDGRIRVTRARFPAGEATILRYTTLSKEYPTVYSEEQILIEAGDHPLNLAFIADRAAAAGLDQAAGLEATAWEIAESVRSATAAVATSERSPVSSCLHPEMVPNFAGSPGLCAIEVGQPLARFDCTAYDVQAPARVSSFRYDVQSGTSTGGANLDYAHGFCPQSAPSRTGIAMHPIGVAPPDGVAVFDVRVAPDTEYLGGLTMRDDLAGRVVVSWGWDRQTRLYEATGAGQTESSRRVGAILGAVAGAGIVHRLVLAVFGGSARGWVDGQPLKGTTSIPSHPGDVQAWVANRGNEGPLSLGILRFHVYSLA